MLTPGETEDLLRLRTATADMSGIGHSAVKNAARELADALRRELPDINDETLARVLLVTGAIHSGSADNPDLIILSGPACFSPFCRAKITPAHLSRTYGRGVFLIRERRVSMPRQHNRFA